MPQSTHRNNFKTLWSKNSYHSYHPPVLTLQSITFQQLTTLKIKKQVDPIHYQLSYLERLGFTDSIIYTHTEIRPGIFFCTSTNTTTREEWLLHVSPSQLVLNLLHKVNLFMRTLSLCSATNTPKSLMNKSTTLSLPGDETMALPSNRQQQRLPLMKLLSLSPHHPLFKLQLCSLALPLCK